MIVGCQGAAQIGEDFVDTLLDSVVAVADNPIAGSAKRIGAGCIVLDLFLMDRPIDLDNQIAPWAAKIHDEPSDWVLTTELKPI